MSRSEHAVNVVNTPNDAWYWTCTCGQTGQTFSTTAKATRSARLHLADADFRRRLRLNREREESASKWAEEQEAIESIHETIRRTHDAP